MFFIYIYSDIGESVKIELNKEDSILLKFIKENNVSLIQYVFYTIYFLLDDYNVKLCITIMFPLIIAFKNSNIFTLLHLTFLKDAVSINLLSALCFPGGYPIKSFQGIAMIK